MRSTEQKSGLQNPSLRVVAAIASGMLVTLVAVAFARLAFGLILPFMRADLGLDYQQAGNLGTAAALGYLFLVMAAGVFASRWGGRNAVLLGLGLTTAGFALLGLGSAYPLLLFAMLLLGCGTAFCYTPVISLLAGCYPARRGMVIGMANSGIGVGMLASSVLMPYLAASLGQDAWRWVWAIFCVTSLIAFGAAFSLLPNQRTGGQAARAAAGASVYRNRRVQLVGLLYGVVGTTYIAQATFMYSFALESGLAPAVAAQLAALLAVLSVFAAPGWGLLSDRIGRPLALTIAVGLNAIGTAIPLFWPTVAGFSLHYLILGCTVSGMFTSILIMAAESVEPQQAPRATSFVTLFYATGQFLGPAAAGFLIQHAGGFRTAFAASTAVLIMGFVVSCRFVFGPRAGRA
jgi:MFS family permease